MPLTIREEWSIPPLPQGPGIDIDGVFLIPAAVLPVVGRIPMGLSRTLDACEVSVFPCPRTEERDGVVSCAAFEQYAHRCARLVDGEAFVNRAPGHDGLEGFPVVTTVNATDVTSRFARPSSRSLLRAVHSSGDGVERLPASFLPIPEVDVIRSARVVSAHGAGAVDVARINVDADGYGWVFLAPMPREGLAIEVPPVPRGLVDRLGVVVVETFAFPAERYNELATLGAGGLKLLDEVEAAAARRVD